MLLQIFTTMVFSGAFVAAAGVIHTALSNESDAIRRALSLRPARVAVPPLPPRYRAVADRRPIAVPVSARDWREAA